MEFIFNKIYTVRNKSNMAIYTPQPSSLEDILKGKRYVVPIYQRPYSWTVDEAQELWSDLKNNSPPYFLGILVLQKTENDRKFKVVDGQQRLATLLLLLRSAVEKLGPNDNLGIRLQGDYIDQKGWGIEEKSEFTLTLSERDKYNFFTIVSENTAYLPPQLSPKEKKIRKRFVSSKKLNKVKDFFSEQMATLFDEHGKNGIISFIQEKVLTLSFIEVKLADDNDIFTFFETLNARGIDLTVADLLKNRVCEVSDDKYEAAKNIDEISSLLGEGKMNSFLLHYSSANSIDNSPPPKKSLMRWYDKTIKDEKDKFLINLKEYAEIYSTFLDPIKTKSTKERDVLNHLKVLGATRCYPLLLVGNKFLSPGDFLRLCKAVETLTFRHSTIVGKDAKILEEVYYKLSQDIKNGSDFNIVLRTLNEKAKQISDVLFKTAFIEYTPANNQVAKYILLKLDDFLSGQSIGLDWDKITLEHILAEKADWDGRAEFLERLGNMALLTEILNKSVGIKEFKFKKEQYKNEKRILLTKKLLEYNDFTKETIVERQKYLAELASKVWKP